MPLPPVVQQVLDAFGVSLLQAVTEWGADDEMEVGSDDKDSVLFDPELFNPAVIINPYVRDFAMEEEQVRELGLMEQAKVERVAAFLALEYEDPPTYVCFCCPLHGEHWVN